MANRILACIWVRTMDKHIVFAVRPTIATWRLANRCAKNATVSQFLFYDNTK